MIAVTLQAATLEETTIPLKKAVAALMAEMLPAFEKRKSVYQEKMESWKSAQAEQNPGEEVCSFLCCFFIVSTENVVGAH